MAEQAQGHVEVRDAGGGVILQVPMTVGRLVIGRSPEVQVQLPSAAVSRQHAELFSDPFGRWWVRDMGSRNGTLVNGTRIDEHLLDPADVIQVEDFAIRVAMAGPVKQRPRTAVASAAALTIADGGGKVTRLQDMQPPKIDASHLSMLTRFSTQLLQTENDDDRTRLLCELMVGKEFRGNTALAMRLNKDDPEDQVSQMLCEPVSAKNWRSGEKPYISRTMLRTVRASESPVVASNVAGGGGGNVVEMSLAASVMEMAAVMCPIHSDPQALDVLYVSFPAEYGTGEWLALTALASEQYQQAKVVWEARRRAQEQAVIEKELERAQKIQMRLIPSDVQVSGAEVAIGFVPCRWVGGDYVDVVPLEDGRVFITICDVCGKGMQAALITACLHTVVHMNAKAGLPLDEFMTRLNDHLCETLPDESFVTAIGMIIDFKTGQCEYANAGHPPAMVAGTDGAMRQLAEAQNPPLGYMPVPIEVSAETLNVGEMFVLFTDGYTELNNEHQQMLGIEGVGECLVETCRSTGAAAIAEVSAEFNRRLTAFQGKAPAMDDLTFLLVRRV